VTVPPALKVAVSVHGPVAGDVRMKKPSLLPGRNRESLVQVLARTVRVGAIAIPHHSLASHTARLTAACKGEESDTAAAKDEYCDDDPTPHVQTPPLGLPRATYPVASAETPSR
jgi:hypothetical protein